MKVTTEDARKLNIPPEFVNKTPSGETFVKSNLQKVIYIYMYIFYVINAVFLIIKYARF